MPSAAGMIGCSAVGIAAATTATILGVSIAVSIVNAIRVAVVPPPPTVLVRLLTASRAGGCARSSSVAAGIVLL